MRIQHNIPAMSSYRNYINNTSALSKNLEKLSSGYKINRAGDDAAGLAISEKMRAQISGLAQAQSNAKSGINLVQTAEGAMTEIHDMLNRMVTLADQSANGTFDNDVDRVQLQKEVNQLKDEINRIADSANFNGIKLLDGSLDENGRVANTTTVFSGLTMANNVKGIAPGETAITTDTKFGSANSKGGLQLTGQYTADTTGKVDKSDNSIRYHQEAKGNGKTSFTVDLDGMNYKADAGTTIKDLLFKMQAGDKDAMGTGNYLYLDEAGSKELKYEVTAGSNGITSEDIATAIQKKIDENDGKVYLKSGGDKYIEYTVTRDGDKLHFEMTNKGYDDAVAAAKVISDKGTTATDAELKKNYFQGNYNFTVVGQAKTNQTTGNGALQDKIQAAFNDKDLGNTSTCEINEGSAATGTIYAQAYIRFDVANSGDTDGLNKTTDFIADGKGIQIGEEYYLFAGSDETFNTEYADNVKVVDIRDLANLNDGKKGTQDFADDLRTALTRLSEAAKDNEMFDVQVEQRGTILGINERTTYTGDANLTEKNWGLEKMIQKFDSASSTTEVVKEAGKALTLQIGDTSESFNQMKVNIKDMHTRSMGIGDIDISTQEGAAAAVEKIKDAVNYVSDVRGTLGATQNRLDHTINNLGVMQENIQDAESTIRDTDVAAEMMEYTKNSILVQSAQAMLAQANQLPQGVLQLLQ